VATASDVILERLMSLHPKIIDLTLDRVTRLLGALDDPHLDLPPVVHIAGTNGKGSTQAMLRAGLEGVGKRVQAYTSPHLARFHERIRLASGLISEDELQSVLEECETANGGVPITYFEITTVAALLAFSRDPADYCLLEVGLGGRLDATNVLDKPKLCVITPVSLDHQQYLGDTLEEIAFEKAGILKPGVPCIVGEQSPEALAVIEDRARAVGADLVIEGQDFQTYEEHDRLVFQDEAGLLDLPLPSLIGAHQAKNAGMAIAGLRALGLGDDACEAAVRHAHWPGRLQHLRTGALVDLSGDAELWLDGGHNAAAGVALAEALGRLDQRPLHLICGMLKTKDVRSYLQPLSSRAKSLLAVSVPGEAATLRADETVSAAQEVGLEASAAQNVRDAITSITRIAPHARILICGSLYLAGHVLRENG